MIDLIDQETGRRARCAVIFHGQAAAVDPVDVKQPQPKPEHIQKGHGNDNQA